MSATSPVSRTQRVDFSDLEAVKRYADNLGPGTVVFKHPMRGAYTVCHKSRTDIYDLSWVVHEVRRKGEPKFIAGSPEMVERQSLDEQANERIQLKANPFIEE